MIRRRSIHSLGVVPLSLLSWIALGCSGGHNASEDPNAGQAQTGDTCTQLVETSSFGAGTTEISSLDVLGDTIVVGTTQTDSTPAHLWFFTTKGAPRADLVVNGGFIVGATRLSDGTFVVANAIESNDQNALELLFVTVDAQGAHARPYDEAGGGRIDAPPVRMPDDTVVVGTGAARVAFIDPSGHKKAEFTPEKTQPNGFYGFVDASPTILADGSISVIASEPRGVYSIDAQGNQKGLFQPGAYDTIARNRTYGTVQLADGTVVASGDRAALMLGESGELKKTVDVAPSLAPVLTTSGDLIFGSQDGAVTIVSPSGDVTKRVPLIGHMTLWNGLITLNSSNVVLTSTDVDSEQTHVHLVSTAGVEKHRSDTFSLGGSILKKVDDHTIAIAESLRSTVHVMSCK